MDPTTIIHYFDLLQIVLRIESLIYSGKKNDYKIVQEIKNNIKFRL